ncbi:hypothetical protein BN1110_06315 [bacterium YEK0313]|nr:hypothetical protein BN1110_06315 [bacterium YEK0313]
MTMYLPEPVYAGLVDMARRARRTPGAHAADLFLAAYSARGGKEAEPALAAAIEKLAAAAAGLTRAPAPPPVAVAPKPPPPKRPPPPAPGLSERGGRMRLAFALKPQQAAVLDYLMDVDEASDDQIRAALAEHGMTVQGKSLSVAASTIRSSTGVGINGLRSIPHGYMLTEAARTQISIKLAEAL